MKADIVFTDDRWEILPLEEVAKTSLALISDHILQKNIDFEIAILAGSDHDVIDLNKRFRGKSIATNILSWPEQEYKPARPGSFPDFASLLRGYQESHFLGNLALSFDRCSSEATEKNICFEVHIMHLLIHGGLHLIGFKHDNELDALLMEDIEKKLLSRLGIKNPYELIDRQVKYYE